MQQAGGLWQNQGPVSLVAGALAPCHPDGHLAQDHAVGQLAEPRPRLADHPRRVPVPGDAGQPPRRTPTSGSSRPRPWPPALSLTAAEIAYLATARRLDGRLAQLPRRAGQSRPGHRPRAWRGVLSALLDFSRIKQALSPGRRAAARRARTTRRPLLPGGQSALLSLTGWAQDSVNALLTQFFGSTDPASLSSVENFRRVYDAYAVVQACGLTASALISAITNAPPATTVSALQSALRARYAEADWLTVIRPINDAARIQQRDALVAYILQQLGDGYAQSTISLTTSAAAAAGATDARAAPTSAGVARRHARPGRRHRPGHRGDRGRRDHRHDQHGHPGRAARRHRPVRPRRPATAFDTAGQPAMSTS